MTFMFVGLIPRYRVPNKKLAIPLVNNMASSSDSSLKPGEGYLQEKEETFIMMKPDGVQRGLIGKVIQRFERKGLKLKAMKFMWAQEDVIREMYRDEKNEQYFERLIRIMTSGPVVPMIWEGVDAVGIGRRTISELITEHAPPGTIRGNWCLHVGRNICHGADDKKEAEMDVELFFGGKVMN